MATGNEPVHPAATIFPMMDDASLRNLANDIKANGQREPVVYWREQVLDGRNRLKACKLAGVEPDTCELDGDNEFDPVAYVVSVNLHRRHLSESQRSMVAVAVKKLREPEKKEKQRKGGGDQKSATAKSKKDAEKSVEANLPQAIVSTNGRAPQARDEAAALLNISPRMVDHAETVRNHGSADLQTLVKIGLVSVSKAAKIAKSTPTNEQAAKAKEKPPKKETTPLDRLKQWWGKANATQRSLFRDWIDGEAK